MEQTKLSRPVSIEAAAATHAFTGIINYAKKVNWDIKKVVMGTAAAVALMTALLSGVTPAHAADIGTMIGGHSVTRSHDAFNMGGGSNGGGGTSVKAINQADFNKNNNYPIFVNNVSPRPIMGAYESPNANTHCKTASLVVGQGLSVDSNSNENYVGVAYNR